MVALTFFDVSGDPIGNVSFLYSKTTTESGELDWHGWTSTTPIKSLTYSGDFVVNDGLQANRAVVPAPAALVLLGSALAGFAIMHPRKAGRSE